MEETIAAEVEDASKCMYETADGKKSDEENLEEFSHLNEHQEENIASKARQYKCPSCEKEFLYPTSRYNHLKKYHREQVIFGAVQCMEEMCVFKCATTTALQNHLISAHSIPMNYLCLDFDNYSDFVKWKEDYEVKEVCRFIKKSGSRSEDKGRISYLYCSRSGKFVSNSKGVKSAPKRGSSKINGHCTAMLKYRELRNGRVVGRACITHYGHDKDCAFLRLTNNQRMDILDKINKGVTPNCVLELARSSFMDKMDKIHTLSMKDLKNLLRFREGVKGRDKEVERDPSVNPVLFHKKAGVASDQLEWIDDCFILATGGQRDLLRRFSPNGILYITTVETKSLFLTSLQAVDEFAQTFPVAFMLANMRDPRTMKVFFEQIARAFGPLSVRAIVTDDEKIVYDLWCDIIGSVPFHVTSNRYVDSAWREAMISIANEELQGNIYDKVYAFIEKADEDLKGKLPSLIEELTSNYATKAFGNFMKRFVDNVRSWATCYLKDSIGLDVPIQYERTCAKIEHFRELSAVGKDVQTATNILVRLVSEFLLERNAKVNDAVKHVKRCHERVANAIHANLVFPLGERRWKVADDRCNANNRYARVCADRCYFPDCLLKCVACEECAHSMRCSCQEFRKWRSCNHVHAVGRMLTKAKGVEAMAKEDVEEEEVAVEEEADGSGGDSVREYRVEYDVREAMLRLKDSTDMEALKEGLLKSLDEMGRMVKSAHLVLTAKKLCSFIGQAHEKMRKYIFELPTNKSINEGGKKDVKWANTNKGKDMETNEGEILGKRKKCNGSSKEMEDKTRFTEALEEVGARKKAKRNEMVENDDVSEATEEAAEDTLRAGNAAAKDFSMSLEGEEEFSALVAEDLSMAASATHNLSKISETVVVAEDLSTATAAGHNLSKISETAEDLSMVKKGAEDLSASSKFNKKNNASKSIESETHFSSMQFSDIAKKRISKNLPVFIVKSKKREERGKNGSKKEKERGRRKKSKSKELKKCSKELAPKPKILTGIIREARLKLD